MKKKLTVKRGTIPKRLNDFEFDQLENSIYLPGWQFETTILPKCIFITEPVVDGYYSRTLDGAEPTYKSVVIYGLMGVSKNSGGYSIANWFVRDGNELYQFNEIEYALKLVEIMRKDWKWIRYLETKEKEKENKKVA